MINHSPMSPVPPAPFRLRTSVVLPRCACALLGLLLILSTGCANKQVPNAPPPSSNSHSQQTTATMATVEHPADAGIAATDQSAQSESCINPQQIIESERNRASCFHLQPARTVLVKQASGKKAKASSKGTAKTATSSKATKKPATKTSKTTQTTKSTATAAPTVERSVGLCQPQSLIYARCRTGIKTCQMGDTSPVQWFACARKNGATSATPVAGSVIVIDTHKERRIYTGHPAYVEEVHRNADGTWTLRISHTNYDRKCHLDQDAQVLFDPRTMTATFQSGPWAPWAHRLRVLGFIVR